MPTVLVTPIEMTQPSPAAHDDMLQRGLLQLWKRGGVMMPGRGVVWLLVCFGVIWERWPPATYIGNVTYTGTYCTCISRLASVALIAVSSHWVSRLNTVLDLQYGVCYKARPQLDVESIVSFIMQIVTHCRDRRNSTTILSLASRTHKIMRRLTLHVAQVSLLDYVFCASCGRHFAFSPIMLLV